MILDSTAMRAKADIAKYWPKKPDGEIDYPALARELGSQCSGPCGTHPCGCERAAEAVATEIERLGAQEVKGANP